jgi:hypothetical protein
MRMAFGLVSVLVTLGIIMILIRDFELPAVEEAHDVQQTTQLLSGRDPNGTPIEKTYTLLPDNRSDGRMLDFRVTQLNADSPLQTAFGVKLNDVILGTIDSHSLPHDFAKDNDDEETCRLSVRDAVAFGGKILVQRDGQRIVLPQAAVPRGVPQPGANPPAARNQPGQPPQQNGNNQDDAMKQINQRLHALPTY